MKNEKLSLKKLSREEMKKVLGGSATPTCASNSFCTSGCSYDGVCSTCCVAAGLN